MNFALSDEELMLRDAARDALSRLDGLSAAREALDGAPLPDVWPIAREAGWTGLLVPEEHGGAGLGFFPAMLLHEECGRRLTGAGLLGHLTATVVLEGDTDAGLLAPLAAGERRAALAPVRPPAHDEGWTVDAIGSPARRIAAPAAELDGDRARVTGDVGYAPDLAGADVVVAGAVDGHGAVHAVLLEAQAGGVEVEPVVRYDATRPLGHLRLAGAEGRVLPGGASALERAWYLAQSLLAAESLGASQALLDMGVAYARTRHTFGRPIGSYQAVKHQLVDILRHIDRTRNVVYYAGFAADDRPEELALAASSARFAGEQAIDYASRTCIAVHGGIGATWEHDAPFFWRRAQLSRLLLGGLADAGDRVADRIVAKARTEAAAA